MQDRHHAQVRDLVHSLVGQRPAPRDDPDPTLLVNEPRHDADLALIRRDDARAVRSDQAGLAVPQRSLHPDHVVDRDALRDADHQTDARISGLEDGVGSKGRGDKNQ